MPNYINVIGDCFPGAEAIVPNHLDPTVYSNLVWITAPIDQATLDASDCAQLPPVVQATSIETSSLVGAVFQLVFNKESVAKNVWLSHEGDNSLVSNQTPALVPFDCVLVACTFTNDVSNADTDVEIYVASNTSGSTDTKVFTWELRGVRAARKTDMVSPIVLRAGDKVGIYLKDQGTNVNDVAVVLYAQILDINNEEGSESYSGNF